MSKSILLADDSATIRRVVEISFGDSEFHVESVASGEEALARLATLHPDVVLADVVMPGPSGYEVCRQIKSSDRPVPVLLLAGTFEEFDHDLARSCGADGCLMKPFDSRTLLDRVHSLLAEREAIRRSPLEAIAEPEPEPVAVDASESSPQESSLADESAELPEGWSAAAVEAIVRKVAEAVVPEIAERLVRQRILELETEDE